NDANQVGDLLHRLNGDNLVDPQCIRDLAPVLVEPLTIQVPGLQELVELGDGSEEGRGAGSLVVLHAVHDPVHHNLVAQVMVDGVRDDERRGDGQCVIVEDRPDAGAAGGAHRVLDLVLVGNVSTVTDEDRTSERLLGHQTHLALEEGDHFEGGDVKKVVA